MDHETGGEAATGDVAVPLASRKRERVILAQQMQHAVPTAGLLAAAAQSLAAGAHGFELALAIAEIATSALLIGGIVRNVRARRARDHGHAPHAHGVDWIDIFVAGVLFTEVAEHWHVTHHIQRPTVLMALVTLALGLMHGRLAARVAKRRSLRVTEEHLHIPGRPFRSITARWHEVAHITLTEHQAEIGLHSGRRRRINFRDLRNAAEVREVLTKAHARLAVAAPKGQAR